MALGDITPVIIAHNAAATIADTLDSLASFPRVVVYENGSGDQTVEICQAYDNVHLVRGGFIGFGPTKNHAAELAETQWVLSLDSDEVLTSALLRSLDGADLSDQNVVYELDRHNFFIGRRVRHSGWGNDWLVRLYHRGAQRFNEVQVHEQVVAAPGARVRRLPGALNHAAITEIGQFLVKIDRYSELRRAEARRSYPLPIIVLKTVWAFFHTYVIRLGFLDGWRGMVIAVSDANGNFYKYIKIYADRALERERKAER
ncbi:MAG: glycosyltransferase family 2 protein [Gammaproteobacteria bacterium]|nr:glycosyltransferase family 2 protein [Gammaproteobacteria bacterium]